jgi:hypothetical protein
LNQYQKATDEVVIKKTKTLAIFPQSLEEKDLFLEFFDKRFAGKMPIFRAFSCVLNSFALFEKRACSNRRVKKHFLNFGHEVFPNEKFLKERSFKSLGEAGFFGLHLAVL